MGSATNVFWAWWNNRPVRPRRGSKVSGVSAAIGVRYGIDPIIVRIGFVVAMIYGGAGGMLYLLCWLLFPKEDPDTGTRPTPPMVRLLLILALLPSLFVFTSRFGVVSVVVSLATLYLLHRNYHDYEPVPSERPTTPLHQNTPRYPGTPEPEATHPVATATAVATESPIRASDGSAEQGVPSPGQPTTPHRPNWDPLGTAPFGWDLPEPGESAEQEATESARGRRNRRWISYATVGLALIAGGAGVADGAAPAVTLAAPLGVLGAGMMVGSFARGGRGLLGLAIPLGALAIVVYTLPLDGPWRGEGSVVETPSSARDVQPRYELSLGDITLDLASLDLATDENVRSAVRVDVGTVIVHVPRDADLTARCSVEHGRSSCGKSALNGPSAVQRVHDPGPDGPGGGRIELDLKVGAGVVEVVRG